MGEIPPLIARMAGKKAPTGLETEEARREPYLERRKHYGGWEDKDIAQGRDHHRGQGVHPGSPPAKRNRTWSLWVAAAAVFALLAAKLCTSGTSSKSVKKREKGGFGLDGDQSFDEDMEDDLWNGDGEVKAVVSFAPFMAGDPLFFEGAANLRPQTVPLSHVHLEDFSLDSTGIPKAWAAYLQGKSPEESAPQEQEPSQGPVDLDWLLGYSSSGSVAEGVQPGRLCIKSGDAIKVAREVSDRYFGTAPVEEPKKSPEAAATRLFSRLIGKVGSGLVTVVTGASRLSNMKFDAHSRNLRSELALIELGNDVERLKERQNDALKEMEQARAKLAAGDESGKAQLEDAMETYLSLLRCEKDLMSTLVQLSFRWTEETNKVLANVASIVTSSAMDGIEEIAQIEASLFNIPKMGKKVFGLSDVLQKEARSKNRCRLVEGVAGQRMKDIDALCSNVGKMPADEFSRLMQQQSEGLASKRADFRSVLVKKKQDPWVADVI